jgi:peptidoglycan/xylan/chitin deacetylase (PgdA/CDA1 family)
MAFKHTVMRCLGQTAEISGLSALAARKYGGAGAILMLHSIVADDYPLPRENTQTTAAFLEKMIRYYLAQRIAVLSLSEAMAQLESGSGRRFVSFTLDDGYRDNLTIALPIFRKYGLPFTMYVTSAFLERRCDDYGWGQLHHLIMDNSVITVDALEERLITGSRDEKLRAYYKLKRWMKDGTLGPERMSSLFELHRVTASDALDRDALTAAELAAAAQTEPLLEIGGHTTSHTRLALQDEATASDDIRQNKMLLESIVNHEVRHFAYPFGDAASCGARDFRLAKAAGFETAVTTRVGNLFAEHLQHRWCLPRLRFLGPCESLGFMESQRSGAVTALETRFGNPVRLE